MARFEFEDEHDLRNVYVGPSPERHRRETQEALQRFMADLSRSIAHQRGLEEEFTSEYGDELSRYGRAYNGKSHDSFGMFVYLEGEGSVAKDEVRPKYAEALVNWFSGMQELSHEEQIAKVGKFLKDLDRVSRR